MLKSPIHRYVNGCAYREAAGRDAWKNTDDNSYWRDSRDWRRQMAVVDLDSDPDSATFMAKIKREFRIRCYAKHSVDGYMAIIRRFLNWVGLPPNQITGEHVREYLDVLVCSDAAPNTVASHLSAIRTAWDKFCFQDLTLGMVTPRKRRRIPAVLSRNEVQNLLNAAPSLRNKLLIGLMYATGMRVGEVVKIKIKDLDLERNTIMVRQGKGNCDREVSLPDCYRHLFSAAIANATPESQLFPSTRPGRYLSPRTVQRVVQQTALLAGINKTVSPHTLRHSYATHCFENGYDIRVIQKILGHLRLETTTIYIKVSQREPNNQPHSPLDDLANQVGSVDQPKQSVGRLKIHRKASSDNSCFRITLEITSGKYNRPVFLTGIRATKVNDDFWSINFPIETDWSTAMEQLTLQQRERVKTAEFYMLVQKVLAEQLSGNENSNRLESRRRGRSLAVA